MEFQFLKCFLVWYTNTMTRKLTRDGITLSIRNWAKRLGVKEKTLYMRSSQGMSDAEILAPIRAWGSLDPPNALANLAIRRAGPAAVSWGERERAAMEAFYAACPPGCVVDHVYPLAGVRVSGLHVLANLQYLSAQLNGIKGNKLDPSVAWFGQNETVDTDALTR